MNQIIILDEQQQANRAVKGYEIYKAKLVEHINPRLFMVKGKYEVEDLTTEEDIDQIFQCSCPDHQYRGVICGHIIAVQFYILGL